MSRKVLFVQSTINPKEAKMAATLTSKEHEVGKEQRHSQGDLLKQISDSIKCLGDILENKIEQLHTDMDWFGHEIKENRKDLKATVNNIDKSIEEAWARIDGHTAELKAHKDVKVSQ